MRNMPMRACLAMLFACIAIRAQALEPQQQLALDIFKELIDINTVTATGDTARYRQEGYRSNHDIIVALETDEEIFDRNAPGIQWLLKHRRNLIEAEFALNEGGGVGLKEGKPIRNSVQTSEKVSLTCRADATDGSYLRNAGIGD